LNIAFEEVVIWLRQRSGLP